MILLPIALQLGACCALFALAFVLLLASLSHESDRQPYILRSLPNVLEPTYVERQWRDAK